MQSVIELIAWLVSKYFLQLPLFSGRLCLFSVGGVVLLLSVRCGFARSARARQLWRRVRTAPSFPQWRRLVCLLPDSFLLTAAALSIVWQRMWRRLGFEGALSVFGVAMVGGVMCCRRARVRFPFRGGSELLLLLVVSWFFLRLRVECDGGRARLFFSSSPVVTRWRSPAFVTPVFCLQVDSCCLLLPIKALVEACYWVRSWVLGKLLVL